MDSALTLPSPLPRPGVDEHGMNCPPWDVALSDRAGGGGSQSAGVAGAHVNCEHARRLYPGWVVRLYYDQSIPTAVLARLSAHPNLELVFVWNPRGGSVTSLAAGAGLTSSSRQRRFHQPSRRESPTGPCDVSPLS